MLCVQPASCSLIIEGYYEGKEQRVTEACRPEEEDSASRKAAKQPVELEHAPCPFKGVVKTKIENQVTRTLLHLGALNHILKSYI